MLNDFYIKLMQVHPCTAVYQKHVWIMKNEVAYLISIIMPTHQWASHQVDNTCGTCVRMLRASMSSMPGIPNPMWKSFQYTPMDTVPLSLVSSSRAHGVNSSCQCKYATWLPIPADININSCTRICMIPTWHVILVAIAGTTTIVTYQLHLQNQRVISGTIQLHFQAN